MRISILPGVTFPLARLEKYAVLKALIFPPRTNA